MTGITANFWLAFFDGPEGKGKETCKRHPCKMTVTFGEDGMYYANRDLIEVPGNIARVSTHFGVCANLIDPPLYYGAIECADRAMPSTMDDFMRFIFAPRSIEITDWDGFQGDTDEDNRRA